MFNKLTKIFTQKKLAEDILKENFANIEMPICLINKNSEIIWSNNFFKNIFQEISTNFEKSFNPQKILNTTQISYKEKNWKVTYTKINENFFLILEQTEAIFEWWMDLPFAFAVLNKNNEIESSNKTFKKLIGNCEGKINKYSQQFDVKKAQRDQGQETIWNSKFGFIPILSWVKNNKDKKLLILENRIEFIKLKNQAQESQHLQILGQLASGIIHDFNNLLTAINGFSELLEQTIPKNDMLCEIKRNTMQAADLAQELLNFVKDKPNEQKTTSLSMFLQARKNMFQKLLGETITLAINAENSGYIELSETQLEQIILNMIINSKDAMKNGGKITINANKITLKTKTAINSNINIEPGNYFLIEISDTGKGISKENINKIFSPFFSTKSKGTGLGLSSCLRIIQYANGTIDVKSNQNGTIFSIYLPLIQEQTKSIKEDVQDLRIEFFKQKLLILAEDDEMIRTLVTKALTQEGYIIISCADGKEALNEIEKAQVEGKKIDGLITDAILPEIDGIQLVKKIKEIDSKIPVLLVSGYSLEDLEKNLPKNIKYLAKPFTLKILKEKVNSIFQ